MHCQTTICWESSKNIERTQAKIVWEILARIPDETLAEMSTGIPKKILGKKYLDKPQFSIGILWWFYLGNNFYRNPTRNLGRIPRKFLLRFLNGFHEKFLFLLWFLRGFFKIFLHNFLLEFPENCLLSFLQEFLTWCLHKFSQGYL